jgi:large subunit ribosomal protein L25
MERVVLQAQYREVIGKQVKALRRQGGLPAVLYGKNTQSIPITLDYREAMRVLPKITSSQLIEVEVNGQVYPALVREKQYHPVQGRLMHVDFMVVSLTDKIRANVAVHLTGESPAVKDLNGVLVTGVEELEVECLPQDLPERIEVDLSILKEIGDAIHVGDIKLPANIRVLTDLEEIVAVVTAPEAEEVEEEIAAAEPEVIERGKKEEEEF